MASSTYVYNCPVCLDHSKQLTVPGCEIFAEKIGFVVNKSTTKTKRELFWTLIFFEHFTLYSKLG